MHTFVVARGCGSSVRETYQHPKVHKSMADQVGILRAASNTHSSLNFGSDARYACLRSVEVYEASQSDLKCVSGAYRAGVIAVEHKGKRCNPHGSELEKGINTCSTLITPNA